MVFDTFRAGNNYGMSSIIVTAVNLINKVFGYSAIASSISGES
jgi:hypothetical protein